MNATIRQKWMDAKAKRAEFIKQSEEAFESGDVAKGNEAMENARAFNAVIEGYENIMAEAEKFTKQFSNPTKKSQM